MNILESFTHHDGRQAMINEMEHQQALALELRGILQPILLEMIPQNGRQTDSVLQLIQEMLSSSSKVISLLQLGSGDHNGKHGNLVGGKRKGGEHGIIENHTSLGNEEDAKGTGNKRRKNAEHMSSLVTETPHYDGYQWRKYGQKWISKARHSRSYYRCANSKGQGCPATKTVQQIETHGGKSVRMFNVDYYGQHTCKGHDIVHPYVVETPHRSVPSMDPNHCYSAMLVNDEAHQVQDESLEELFIVPDMPDYLKELEMARVMEVTRNLQLDSDSAWMFDDWLRCEQQSPLYMWW